jgi:site-specific DNA-adenine methylase
LKTPALENYVNDLNPVIIEYLSSLSRPNTNITRRDALNYLLYNIWRQDDFVYLDPPYPVDARRSTKNLYNFEMLADGDHVKLLSAARDLKNPVMISTRENPLYAEMLHDWRMEKFLTSDRGGAVYEVIYMNYPKPEFLHEYTFVGNGRTKRQ